MQAIQNITAGMTYKAKRFPKAKEKTLFTVEDIHTTFNSKGEQVKTRYVVSHVFMGQKVTQYDVLKVTIQRAMFDQ